MRSFTATFFLIALAENLLVPDSGGGLTIYRIGGSDMDPPPEADMEGVEFVPLSWEGAAQGFDGQMQGLTTEGEQIAPLLITPDDNVMLGALARGGGAVDFSISGDAYFKFALLDAMTDGDPATTFNLRDAGKGLERYPRNVSSRVLFDLGTRFPINRVRMYPDPRFPERYVEEFSVMAVVGPLTPRLFPGEATEVLRSETANRNPVVDVSFPRRNLAQLLLHVRSPGLWEIAEFEVYGDGYVPEATYRSAVLRAETGGDRRGGGGHTRSVGPPGAAGLSGPGPQRASWPGMGRPRRGRARGGTGLLHVSGAIGRGRGTGRAQWAHLGGVLAA